MTDPYRSRFSPPSGTMSLETPKTYHSIRLESRPPGWKHGSHFDPPLSHLPSTYTAPNTIQMPSKATADMYPLDSTFDLTSVDQIATLKVSQEDWDKSILSIPPAEPRYLSRVPIMQSTSIDGLEHFPPNLAAHLLCFRADPKNHALEATDFYFQTTISSDLTSNTVRPMGFQMSLKALRSQFWADHRPIPLSKKDSWTNQDSDIAAGTSMYVEWCAYTKHITCIQREWCLDPTPITQENYAWVQLALWLQKGWHRIVYTLSDEAKQLIAQHVYARKHGGVLKPEEGNLLEFMNAGVFGPSMASDKQAVAASSSKDFADQVAKRTPVTLDPTKMQLHQHQHQHQHQHKTQTQHGKSNIALNRARAQSAADMHKLWASRGIVPLQPSQPLHPYIQLIQNTASQNKKEEAITQAARPSQPPIPPPDAMDICPLPSSSVGGSADKENEGPFRKGANAGETLMDSPLRLYPAPPPLPPR
ncbi:hypothetical protein EJ05DRAFT_160753 [Pseudovirgaria hyperparasitica]|uniref:Uncharacterized protein n=1 Tax=Pseudovirgaria hyperparasitica TaxID=470096 RepID=A0A6A6VWD4_9PEZI|nr:uncharacterized protein EJ05DRAFT_160753 [Pseudovirgaria hyperparasitica]KAF2753950.1 hypothetical protein EJ05DRAFT_160753 [Pseudovirgaria hyperparasitica]